MIPNVGAGGSNPPGITNRHVGLLLGFFNGYSSCKRTHSGPSVAQGNRRLSLLRHAITVITHAIVFLFAAQAVPREGVNRHPYFSENNFS